MPMVEEELNMRDHILWLLKKSLEQAQQRMKALAYSHRIDIHFQVGDSVLVKLQPYRQSSVQQRINKKLSARYHGLIR